MASYRIKRIVNHWSVSGQGTTVEDIRQWHKNAGYRDIGYHRVILYPMQIITDANELYRWWDLVKQGRQLDSDIWLNDLEQGAGVYGFNRDSIHICTIGHPGYRLHPLQREAIIKTNLILVDRFGLKLTDIVCHRDLTATQCPGDEIAHLVKEIKEGKYTL